MSGIVVHSQLKSWPCFIVCACALYVLSLSACLWTASNNFFKQFKHILLSNLQRGWATSSDNINYSPSPTTYLQQQRTWQT